VLQTLGGAQWRPDEDVVVAVGQLLRLHKIMVVVVHGTAVAVGVGCNDQARNLASVA